MSPIELFICAVLVFFSAFLSSSEIALFSLSRFQLRSLKEGVRPGIYRKIKRLLGDPGGLLVTLLVVNEIVNIGLSSLITRAVSSSSLPTLPIFSRMPPWIVNVGLGIACSAPIVLFLCEVTPKVIGVRAAALVAPLTIAPLSLIYDLLKPVRLALKKFVALVSRWLRAGAPDPAASDNSILKESDFLLMIEEGHREGAIQENEMELIKNVFEMDDTRISELMTPINQAQTLTTNTTVKGALSALRSQKFSRIPVTLAGGRRQIAGILYSKDLLKAKLEPELMSQSVSALMRKPLFVSPTMRLNALFRKFKQQRTHMAVVLSPSGDTLGIVTMNNLLEELFEDLLEEDDAGIPLARRKQAPGRQP